LPAARAEPVHWVRGNSEREAVAAYDGVPGSDDPAGRAAAWSAGALDQRWRDELAAWPISLELGGVRFCHGSPRRDDEILIRLTPDQALGDAVGATAERLVLGGHTHQQMVRRLGDMGSTCANAGSVGMPYEGPPGAFWMLVDDGEPVLRETGYDDLQEPLAELQASGSADVEDQLVDSLLEPADPDLLAAFFGRGAGRGEPNQPDNQADGTAGSG